MLARTRTEAGHSLTSREVSGRLLSAVAQRQHGVIATWQLADIGLDPDRVLRLRREERIGRLHRGVYAISGVRIGDRGRWLGAVLACGCASALGGRSALVAWGLSEGERGLPSVTSPGNSRPPKGVERCGAALEPDEVRLKDNIPVTSPLRTLFDTAGDLGAAAVERIMATGIENGMFRPLDVGAGLERYRGRRGVATVRRVHLAGLAEMGRTRSHLEETFLAFLDSENLPRPRLNVRMRLAGGEIEADCVWQKERVIAELDGWSTHSGRWSFFRDRRRDRGLAAEGWRTIRITDRDLRGDRAGLAADLRGILGRGLPTSAA